MPARIFQNNFSGGEFSPAMYSRVDLSKYATGAELIENGIVHPHGGVSKRGGSRFVGALPGPGYLIPFIYRVEQAYVLCFCDNPEYDATDPDSAPGLLLVFADGGLVHTTECPYTYAEAVLMSVVQSADTVFIAHSHHPPRKLVRYAEDSWVFERMVFTPGIAAPTRPTITTSGFSSSGVRPLKYQISAVSSLEEESYPSEAGSVNVPKSWTAGATVNLAWTAVAGAVRYNIYKNQRGFYGWIGTVDATADSLSFADDNISPAADDGPKTEGISFNQLPTPPEALWTVPQGLYPYQVRIAVRTNERDESIANAMEEFSTGLHFTGVHVKLPAYDPGDGIARVEYLLYYRRKEEGEPWRRLRYVSTSPDFSENDIAVDTSLAELAAPRDSYAYPGVVGIYQQRLVFARSDGEPQTIWCSQTGALNNFSTSYPLKDTDAIEVAMDSRQMNEIRHLYLLKNQLVVLTAGAEWFMGPGRNSDGITPTNVHFQNQSFYGCSVVPPLQAGEALLLLQNSGRAVRDLYGTYTDEYEGNEVSIMAEHLFSSPIIDWSWQEEPYHTAYAVRDDGVMLCFTYMREQQLSAWSRLVTNGRYRSVSCIREQQSDRVYVVVERVVDGETRYFVELIAQRRYGDPIEDAFYVDCGVTRTFAEATTLVTGLEHLAGCEVAALADGGEVRGLVVSDHIEYLPEGGMIPKGSVRLPHPASKVQIGMPYGFILRTLDPELNGSAGSTMGLRKNAVSAVLRVRETRGVQVGPDEDHLVAAKFPTQRNWSGPDSAPPLFTGDIPLVLAGLHRREATLCLRQDSPLPATILSLNVTVNSEDR